MGTSNIELDIFKIEGRLEGVEKERERAAAVLNELNLVTIPLSNRALEIQRDIRVTNVPRALMRVSNDLQTNGFGAITEVTQGSSKSVEIATLQGASSGLVQELLDHIVDRNRTASVTNPGTVVYPTLASRIFVGITGDEDGSRTIKLFAARPEDMAEQGVGLVKPSQRQESFGKRV